MVHQLHKSIGISLHPDVRWTGELCIKRVAVVVGGGGGGATMNYTEEYYCAMHGMSQSGAMKQGIQLL